MRRQFTSLLLALSSVAMYAGGYRVSIQGGKQLAMGHTGVAVVNSSEVLFFNPAGGSFLKDKFNISAGVGALIAKTKLQNSQYNFTAASDNIGTPFYLYANYKINNWLSAGLAVYTPYGSKVEWPQNWQGAYLVNNIDLKAIFVQPSVSIMFEDILSIGGGPIFATGSVKFNRNLTANATFGNTNLTLDAQGISDWGYNLGLMLKPIEQVTLGLNYRSKLNMTANDAPASYAGFPDFAASNFSGNYTFSASIPLPAEITTGLSVQATKKLLLAFDWNHTKWSAYKSLDVAIKNTATGAISNSINARNYQDSNTYRFGAQYMINPRFTARAGYYIDNSPILDGYFAPETPRNTGTGYTGGLTFQVNKKLGVDLSVLYIHFKEINNTYEYGIDPISNSPAPIFGGTYKSTVISPTLGVTYSL